MTKDLLSKLRRRTDGSGYDFVNIAYADIFKDNKEILRAIKKHDRASLIAFVGGLSTVPALQANTFRIEVLQHFIVRHSTGSRKPSIPTVTYWLNHLGEKWSGRMEDPIEDVFTSRVYNKERNFIIFEGLYESSEFFLQRFINVIEKLPMKEPYLKLKRSVYALLALSSEVASRSGVAPYVIGGGKPKESIPRKTISMQDGLSDRIKFTNKDLTNLNIVKEDIKDFIATDQCVKNIDSSFHHSSLLGERPIIEIDGDLYLSIPSSVSAAIRHLIIETYLNSGYCNLLQSEYAEEIANTFHSFPKFRNSTDPKSMFENVNGLYVSNFARPIDFGRTLHLCAIVDDFNDFKASGVGGMNPRPHRIVDMAKKAMKDMHRDLSRIEEFQKGLSIIVLCGWGQGMMFDPILAEDPRWKIEIVPLSDLVTLYSTQGFSDIELWKMLEAKSKLSRLGVHLFNINGLLNLYAWSESLHGHLVEHETFSSYDLRNNPLEFVINQNSLLDLRRSAKINSNVHKAKTCDNRNVTVRRYLEHTIFSEDRGVPFYCSIDDIDNGDLLGVYETGNCNWWITVKLPNLVDAQLHYKLWRSLALWVKKSAGILESKFTNFFSEEILWLCCFEDSDIPDQETIISAKKSIPHDLIGIVANDNTVHVTVRSGFLAYFMSPVNIAERALVDAFVSGTCQLFVNDASRELVESLVDEIVVDPAARDLHMFPAVRFQDIVPDNRPDPILVSKRDDAFSRIGVGWISNSIEKPQDIVGVDNCCKYLEKLVDSIWTSIQSMLKTLDREKLIFTLLNNHDSIQKEIDRWNFTARSIRSVHTNKDQATHEASAEIAHLNAGALATRILIEMALCECPKEGGAKIGTLDISSLQAIVLRIVQYGGWLEAIRYNAKSDKIRVTSLGDVHTDISFDDEIVAPYEQTLASNQFIGSADSYEENFRIAGSEIDGAQSVEGLFHEAWEDAFGFTIDNMRYFFDMLEDEGIRQQKSVFPMTGEQVLQLGEPDIISDSTIEHILDAFSLPYRDTWTSTPDGFSKKDWYPWRMRRRLSLVCKPIIRLNNSSVRYLISPALIRKSAAIVVQYSYIGRFDAKDFPKGKMRSWIGSAENKRGHQFNKEVAKYLEEYEWNVASDIKLTKILNCKIEKDYGDVDVLAWKGNRILAIECKDLEMAMTMGDIARQLSDFRGMDDKKSKPDRLKKHLNRIEVLNNRIESVGRFISSDQQPTIESILVFSRVVPMHYANLSERHSVKVLTKEDLSCI